MTCWLCGFETTQLYTNAKAPSCNYGPCHICLAVSKVDKEISQAMATLRRLLAKRCDLRSEQNRAHDLVQRLPVELKNHIFELLLPPRDEWGEVPGEVVGMRTVKPSYLASICRGWRDIACSNPFLWSNVHIALPRKFPTSDRSSRISFLYDWMLRSRALPLTLHIVVQDGSEEELKGVIDVISRSSDRWRSLSIDIPLRLLHAFHHSNFQNVPLKSLRIIARGQDIIRPVRFLNLQICPEKVEFHNVSFRSLQISWNSLSAAQVGLVGLGDVVQLFRHAPQMTDCVILAPHRTHAFSIIPFIHQRLESLSLCSTRLRDVAATLLGSLTLPCLREFKTNELRLLSPPYLPALVHRSSCPLTTLTLFRNLRGEMGYCDDLQPFPGVTDIRLVTADDTTFIRRILLQDYFPNLRYLTFRLQPFLYLWGVGHASILLQRRRRDVPNEGIFPKVLVADQGSKFDDMWNSNVGVSLKASLLNISLREDGFEIL